MSDTSNLDLNDPALQAELDQLKPGIRGALNKFGEHVVRANEAESRAASLERELAVERAGIPATPMRELFLKAYDGPSDAESIRAKAEEYGLLSAPVVGVSASELAAHSQLVSASVGGQAPVASEDLAVALRNAKNPADVLRIVALAERSNPEAGIVLPPSI